ncbi:MAG: hypothetical protein Q9227_008217 [Pyrenula ochraceoflavens]
MSHDDKSRLSSPSSSSSHATRPIVPIFEQESELSVDDAEEDKPLPDVSIPSTEEKLPKSFDVQEHIAGLLSNDRATRLQSLASASAIVHSLDEGQLQRLWKAADHGLDLGTPTDIRIKTFHLLEQIIQVYEFDTSKALEWLQSLLPPATSADEERLLRILPLESPDDGLSSSEIHLSLVHTLDRLISNCLEANLKARKVIKRDKRAKSLVTSSDANLHGLLVFTMEYLSLDGAKFPKQDLETLTHRLVEVSGKAYTVNRIEDVVNALEVLVQHTLQEPDLLVLEIKVLCNAYAVVASTSAQILSIVKSVTLQSPGNAQSHFMSILSSDAKEANSSAVKGALRLYALLISDTDEALFPEISFNVLVASLRTATTQRQSIKVDAEILQFSTAVFASRHTKNIPRVARSEWIELVTEIIVKWQDDTSQSVLTEAAALWLLDEPKSSENFKSTIRERLTQHAVSSSDIAYSEFFFSIFALVLALDTTRDELYTAANDSVLQLFTKLDFRLAAANYSALVAAFLRALRSNSSYASGILEKIMAVAEDQTCHVKARIMSFKLLFRLRCDSSANIYVLHEPEGQSLAVAFGRADQPVSEFWRVQDGSSDLDPPRKVTSASKEEHSSILWEYPGLPGLPEDPPTHHGCLSASREPSRPNEDVVDIPRWTKMVTECMQKDDDWELRSYALVHFSAQLANIDLFKDAHSQIQRLRQDLVQQMLQGGLSSRSADTASKKDGFATCVLSILASLVPYHSLFSKAENDILVKCFLQHISAADGPSRVSLHALSICCLEIPRSLTPSVYPILTKIASITSQPTLAIHTLEFLLNLARLPDLCRNLSTEEYRILFGIGIQYMEKARRDKKELATLRPVSDPATSSRPASKPAELGASANVANEIPQYISALAYHVMVHWFLTAKLSDRSRHASSIIKRLVYTDDATKTSTVEEQGLVLDDMMQRTVGSDIGETGYPKDFFRNEDGQVTSASFIVGKSIVSIDVGGSSGRSIITKRQASGTTHSIHYQNTLPFPRHHVPIETGISPESDSSYGSISMLPLHILLQLVSTVAPMNLASQPIPLNLEQDYVKRALSTFDRNNTVDGHRVGVVYIGQDHRSETEILSNNKVSKDFINFLDGLGTLCPLNGPEAKTWSFDSSTDGLATYAWRDRISEIVFHVPSIMPTFVESDPQCSYKKRHIGNDHVKIVFNESGDEYDVETFPSQFNFINIVISPATLISPQSHEKEEQIDHIAAIRETVEAIQNPTSLPKSCTEENALPAKDYEQFPRGHVSSFAKTNPSMSVYHTRYYKVQVITALGMSKVSPVSTPKVVSGVVLSTFVRLLALNASLYSLVSWHVKDDPASSSPYPSSWRERLRQISMLRDRAAKEQIVSLAVQEETEEAELSETASNDVTPSSPPRPRRSLMSGWPFKTSEKKTLPAEEAAEKPAPDFENAATAGKDESLADWLDFSRWTSPSG